MKEDLGPVGKKIENFTPEYGGRGFRAAKEELIDNPTLTQTLTVQSGESVASRVANYFKKEAVECFTQHPIFCSSSVVGCVGVTLHIVGVQDTLPLVLIGLFGAPSGIIADPIIIGTHLAVKNGRRLHREGRLKTTSVRELFRR